MLLRNVLLSNGHQDTAKMFRWAAAQVFIALATHLDAYEPQTVGSLERLSKPGVGAPLSKALRRVVTALKGAPSRRR